MVYSGITYQSRNLWIGKQGNGYIICRDGEQFAEVLDRAEDLLEAVDKLLAIRTGIKTPEDVVTKLMEKNND